MISVLIPTLNERCNIGECLASVTWADELVVVDSALRPGVSPEQWQERILNDGSRHRVYKRYFTGEQLARELDGEKLLEGTWFVASRTSWRPAPGCR